MFAFIAIVALIFWIGNTFGDSAGSIAVGVVVLFLIVMFCFAWNEHGKAYGNKVSYWAKSGKDRARLRRQWEREAREEEERERRIARERAERKLEKRMARESRKNHDATHVSPAEYEWLVAPDEKPRTSTPVVRTTPAPAVPANAVGQVRTMPPRTNQSAPVRNGERLFVCHTCGRSVRTIGRRRFLWDGRVATEFYCPRCKANRTTNI